MTLGVQTSSVYILTGPNGTRAVFNKEEESSNRLENGSFENELEYWESTTVGTVTSPTFGTTEAWSIEGAKAATLKGTFKAAELCDIAVQQGTTLVVPGNKYKATASINVQKIPSTSKVRVFITWLTAAKTTISTVEGNFITSKTIGTSVIAETAAPSNAAFAVVGVVGSSSTGGEMEYYVDNLKLCVMGTDVDFVGYLTETTGLDSPEVREAGENLSGLDGGIHGNFYYGRRPITLTGQITDPISAKARSEKADKIKAASDAMREDAVLEWTNEGAEPVFIKVRRGQGGSKITGGWVKDFQIQLIAADPRIYARELRKAEVEIVPPTPTKTGKGSIDIAQANGFVYVVNETDATVQYYEKDANKRLKSLGTIATGASPCACVATPDGKHLYVLNKGASTIQKYSLNASTGVPTSLGTKACLASPTAIAINDGSVYLAVINAANKIEIFLRTASSGELASEISLTTPTGTTCVCAVPTGFKSKAPVEVIYEFATGGGNKIGLFLKKGAGAWAKLEEFVAEEHGIKTEGIVGIAALIPGPRSNQNMIAVIGEGGEVSYAYTILSSETGKKFSGPFVTIIEEAGFTSPANIMFKLVGEVPYILITDRNTNLLLFYNIETLSTTPHTEVPAIEHPRAMVRDNNEGLWILAKEKEAISEYVLSGATATQVFPTTTGSMSCVNSGNTTTFPLFTYKPTAGASVISPSIVDLANHDAVVFSQALSEEIIVDMLNRTVKNGTGLNQFSKLNFSTTKWFGFESGENKVEFSTSGVNSVSHLIAEYRNAWM